MANVLDEIREEMRAVYLHDDRPWMVGFSGGKDSTLMLSLVIEMLQGLKQEELRKKVYVVSSDTGVENPVFQRHMHGMARLINENCAHLGVEARVIRPPAERSFWSCLIGLGYQAPEMPYIRWCTCYLKIKPMNAFALGVIRESGEVVHVLGVRKAESAVRMKRLTREKIEGKVLVRHNDIRGAYTYNPLADISTEQVWDYLLSGDAKSPWGSDNRFLWGLYQGEEMPEESSVLGHIDDSRLPVQGNTRFGCWCCTIACKDTALQNFIEKGYAELKPLRDFKQWLAGIRNDPQYKDYKSRRGVVTDDVRRAKGFGTFSLYGRETILKKLLELEEETGFSIVSDEELKFIDSCWEKDGDITRRRLADAYYSVKKKRLSWDRYRVPLLDDVQIGQIRELCGEHKVDFELFCRLLAAIEGSKHKTRSNKSAKEFDLILEQEWVSCGEVAAEKERIGNAY